MKGGGSRAASVPMNMDPLGSSNTVLEPLRRKFERSDIREVENLSQTLSRDLADRADAKNTSRDALCNVLSIDSLRSALYSSLPATTLVKNLLSVITSHSDFAAKAVGLDAIAALSRESLVSEDIVLLYKFVSDISKSIFLTADTISSSNGTKREEMTCAFLGVISSLLNNANSMPSIVGIVHSLGSPFLHQLVSNVLSPKGHESVIYSLSIYMHIERGADVGGGGDKENRRDDGIPNLFSATHLARVMDCMLAVVTRDSGGETAALPQSCLHIAHSLMLQLLDHPVALPALETHHSVNKFIMVLIGEVKATVGAGRDRNSSIVSTQVIDILHSIAEQSCALRKKVFISLNDPQVLAGLINISVSDKLDSAVSALKLLGFILREDKAIRFFIKGATATATGVVNGSPPVRSRRDDSIDGSYLLPSASPTDNSDKKRRATTSSKTKSFHPPAARLPLIGPLLAYMKSLSGLSLHHIVVTSHISAVLLILASADDGIVNSLLAEGLPFVELKPFIEAVVEPFASVTDVTGDWLLLCRAECALPLLHLLVMFHSQNAPLVSSIMTEPNILSLLAVGVTQCGSKSLVRTSLEVIALWGSHHGKANLKLVDLVDSIFQKNRRARDAGKATETRELTARATVKQLERIQQDQREHVTLVKQRHSEEINKLQKVIDERRASPSTTMVQSSSQLVTDSESGTVEELRQEIAALRRQLMIAISKVESRDRLMQTTDLSHRNYALQYAALVEEDKLKALKLQALEEHIDKIVGGHQEERARYQKGIEYLQSRVESQDITMHSLKNEMDIVSNECMKLKGECAELAISRGEQELIIRSKSEDLFNCSKLNEELHAKMIAMRSVVQEREMSESSLRQVAADLKICLKDLEERLDVKNLENIDERKKVARLAEEVKSLSEVKVSEARAHNLYRVQMEEEVKRLSAALDSAKIAIGDLEGKVAQGMAALESQAATHAAQCHQLESISEKKETTIHSLTSTLHHKEEKLQTVLSLSQFLQKIIETEERDLTFNWKEDKGSGIINIDTVVSPLQSPSLIPKPKINKVER